MIAQYAVRKISKDGKSCHVDVRELIVPLVRAATVALGVLFFTTLNFL
jgi:hypothetical protein